MGNISRGYIGTRLLYYFSAFIKSRASHIWIRKIPSHGSFEINTLETCFGYLYIPIIAKYTPRWLWQCVHTLVFSGCIILWYFTMRWKTMWHYKLPTRQHARTYTRCLLKECCSDNVCNYYYYYCRRRRRRRRWLRVNGANYFIRFVYMGTKFGARTDDFFRHTAVALFMYIYIYI